MVGARTEVACPTAAGRSQRADRWWTFVSPGYDRAVALVGWHRWLADLVEGVDGGVVLEVGCGPASWLAACAPRGVNLRGARPEPGDAPSGRRATHGRASGRAASSGATSPSCRSARGRSTWWSPPACSACSGRRNDGPPCASWRASAEARSGCSSRSRAGDAGTHAAEDAPARLLADGPIALAELMDAGLRPELVGPARLAGVYSQVRATPRTEKPNGESVQRMVRTSLPRARRCSTSSSAAAVCSIG